MVSPLYLTCSLSFNDICYEGKMGGLTALCKMLKSNSTLLELDLNNNQLCGLDHDGDGNYTAEGITKITRCSPSTPP